MKTHALFLVILILLLIGNAGATVYNSTVLLTTDYNAEMKMEPSDAFKTSAFSFTAPSNNAIVVTGMNYYTEGTTYNFRFARPSSSDITGSVTLSSTGWFTGEETLSVDGGTSSKISYYKVPLYPAYPSTTWFFITTGSGYYFTVADSSRFNFAVSGDIFHPVYAPYKFDTAADSYIQVGGDPSVNPMTGITITPLNSGSYSAMTYYESIPALKEAVKYTNNTQDAYASSGFDLSFFKKLIDVLYSAYKQMQNFFNAITTLSTWVMAIGLFLLAGQVLVGAVVLHLLINIVYCMSVNSGPGGDMFKAFLMFIDNEKKLLEFFRMIVLFIKDLIKWW